MGSQRTRSQEIFPDLSGPPGPGDHREVGPVRAKFQSRGSRAPLSGEETAGPRRARGPWSARERPDLAERSEAFQPQPEWSAHFPATAGTTGHRPSSGSGLLRGAGTLGEGANFSFLLAPGSPPPPPGEQLQRPRRGREGRLRRTEGGGWAGGGSLLPAAALGLGGAPSSPVAWGRGGAAPAGRSCVPSRLGGKGGEGSHGGCPPRPGMWREGCERFVKLAEIPPQLAAAGGVARGFPGLPRLRSLLAGDSYSGL